MSFLAVLRGSCVSCESWIVPKRSIVWKERNKIKSIHSAFTVHSLPRYGRSGASIVPLSRQTPFRKKTEKKQEKSQNPKEEEFETLKHRAIIVICVPSPHNAALAVPLLLLLFMNGGRLRHSTSAAECFAPTKLGRTTFSRIIKREHRYRVQIIIILFLFFSLCFASYFRHSSAHFSRYHSWNVVVDFSKLDPFSKRCRRCLLFVVLIRWMHALHHTYAPHA